MKNLGSYERFVRLIIGTLLIQGGYFWFAGSMNWFSIALGIILILTATIGFCPLYRALGWGSIGKSKEAPRLLVTTSAVLVLISIIIGGSYASIFLSRKDFLEKFNSMNQFYKQALFFSGNGDRTAAIANFDKFVPAFEAFATRYRSYRPYNLKGDAQLVVDFDTVKTILVGVDAVIRTGDLHEVHLMLEKVRPVFQSMFKRNGFSMLAVALVDFHDAMELILEKATAKDAEGIYSLYEPVSEKLKAVEAETNDQEIQEIRSALDNLLAATKSNELDSLPSKGDLLKSSFVKVYLKRG